MYDFTGRVALITGSSSGIGAATAILLAKAGARVVITGRNYEKLAAFYKQCTDVSPHKCRPAVQVVADVTNEADMDRLLAITIDTFGQLDILVNNVGFLASAPIDSNDYMKNFRQTDVAMMPVFIFAELSVEFDPNDHGIRDNPTYNTFVIAACYFCALINELYSVKKEVFKGGDVRHEYLYLIMVWEGCSAQTAADRIVSEAKVAYNRVLDYGKQLNMFNIPALDRYVTEAIRICDGNHYWSTICERYNSWNK
ncbi:unnamed protein product [Medioppia subpectinata]|uniref:Uncharacterized protein n=1 Tax=Medioppia subpectinata TaxID=1979941 RepID=A0A7R9KV26_9ACAR|nr:unnamed protein product [Medioppia subpectinata]CAG2110251.1 unnamed protein product [Medioppia subpectinata]